MEHVKTTLCGAINAAQAWEKDAQAAIDAAGKLDHFDGGVMRLVILESPYAGDVPRNLAYARACMADCLARGEAPYASHLLYAQPGVLDDTKPDERALGMAAGFAWGECADATVVYTDLGTSAGMVAWIERSKAAGRTVEMRTLPGGALQYDDPIWRTLMPPDTTGFQSKRPRE